LDSARRNNSVVYAVSAGRLPDKSFLRELSSITGGSLYEVESTKNLDSIFLNILKEFRQRYLLTYAPQNVSPVSRFFATISFLTRGSITSMSRTPKLWLNVRRTEADFYGSKESQ
jgi:hypothetical protein